MATRCWYCSRSDRDLTNEHVLSQANFGGRLVSRRAVCQPCNGLVGRLEREIVSGPFLSEYVGRDRDLFNPRLREPEVQGTAEGAELRVRLGTQGARVSSRVPRQLEAGADGTPVWEVAADAEAKFRERRAEPIDVVARDADYAPGLELRFGIGDRTIDAWPRFGAKVALALASLVLQEDWLDSPGARGLQLVVAGRPYPQATFPEGFMFGPRELDPSLEPGSLLRPGEHVLGLDSDHGGRAWMLLFGALEYHVPLPDADVPASEPTWLLLPQGPTREPAAGKELLEELRLRRDASPPAA